MMKTWVTLPIQVSIFNNKESLVITKSNAYHEIHNVPLQYFRDKQIVIVHKIERKSHLHF